MLGLFAAERGYKSKIKKMRKKHSKASGSQHHDREREKEEKNTMNICRAGKVRSEGDLTNDRLNRKREFCIIR